jgi:hypothetical protein
MAAFRRRGTLGGRRVRLLLILVAVAQTKALVGLLCVCDKVSIPGWIISVAEVPLRPPEPASRGPRNWSLSNPYKGLGLCDSHPQEQQRCRDWCCSIRAAATSTPSSERGIRSLPLFAPRPPAAPSSRVGAPRAAAASSSAALPDCASSRRRWEMRSQRATGTCAGRQGI